MGANEWRIMREAKYGKRDGGGKEYRGADAGEGLRAVWAFFNLAYTESKDPSQGPESKDAILRIRTEEDSYENLGDTSSCISRNAGLPTRPRFIHSGAPPRANREACYFAAPGPLGGSAFLELARFRMAASGCKLAVWRFCKPT